ncbi:MAG: hypothetical protein NTX19_00230 [Gemmatimonadetes bacterium]|nr:hypothetical protein [Gemmatimonadota bacterium]
MAEAPETPSIPTTGDAAGPAVPRGFIRRHWLATTMLILIGIPTFVFTVWAGVALKFSYSEGTRTGFVQKLSKKGWVCKTWEGEMAMTAQPGVAPTLFQFTVRLDSVAGEVTRLEGKQVTLTYAEHKGVPSSCFGETGHYVSGVSAVLK